MAIRFTTLNGTLIKNEFPLASTIHQSSHDASFNYHSIFILMIDFVRQLSAAFVVR